MSREKFFGYWIVFYCFVLMFFVFTIIKSLHSLFLVPVTESLGMERSTFSLIFTITGLSVAVALPVVSKLLNRYSVKIVATVGILMASLGFAAYSMARASWQFYLIALIVGAGTAGCTNVVIALLINNWFIDRKGMAMGIAFTGSGFGTAIISPILSNFLIQYGWQFSYICCGLLMAIVCIPLTWLLAYKKPSEKGQHPYQQATGIDVEACLKTETGPALREIKSKGFFWLYLVAIFICSTVVGGVHIHIPAYFTDLGYNAAFVALIYSAYAIFLIVGKILLGFIFDTKGSKWGIVFLGATVCIAFTCLILAKQMMLAMAFTLFYGCGATFTSVGVSYLTSSFFGQRDYAEIISWVNIFYVIGAALGPFISGVVYDYTGGYDLIWRAYLLLFACFITVLWCLKTYLDKHYTDMWC